jgi:hypothetical protein
MKGMTMLLLQSLLSGNFTSKHAYLLLSKSGLDDRNDFKRDSDDQELSADRCARYEITDVH